MLDELENQIKQLEENLNYNILKNFIENIESFSSEVNYLKIELDKKIKN